jgi:thymidylate kinase
MRNQDRHNPPRMVSFSGIDGAGKSTQIDALRARLAESGLRVRVLAFWNEIACLTQFRESLGHSIFKGDKGVGSPAAPIERRDKNVQSPVMTASRFVLYLIDALSARHVFRKLLRSNADVVIFDRFVYDELANFPLKNRFNRLYVRLLMKLVPRPDISYVLDASPTEARARKPEYPLEFLIANRESYLALSDLIGGIHVMPPMAIEKTSHTLWEDLRSLLSSSGPRGVVSSGLDCPHASELLYAGSGEAAVLVPHGERSHECPGHS